MSGPSPLVRLVDDDADLLAAQVQALRLAGFRAEPFPAAAPALEGLGPDYPGVILSDVRMPGMDGFDLFRRVHAMDAELPFILLTGHGDVPMAVAALKSGVWDFLTKPVGVDDLTAALRRAAAARALVLENRALRAARPAPEGEDLRLSGNSAAMVHLRQMVSRVAEVGVDALISGPVGAGKEAVARALHVQGGRRGRPFVHVVCAALDIARFEADFFGTAALGPRAARLPGYLEKAQRGTLFLDGIDMLSDPLQARLLAVLGAGEITPAGAASPRQLDLRLLASASADLAARVAAGAFRADLMYRLSGITLHVPPLSARREDVPYLFRGFLVQACHRLAVPVPAISAAMQARLVGHDWRGNLRELQQFAEAAAIGPGFSVVAQDGGGYAFAGLAAEVAGYEAELIRSALRQSGGSVAAALTRLQVPRKTLYDKMARHGIDPSTFRPVRG